jgi:hypothetical protein
MRPIGDHREMISSPTNTSTMIVEKSRADQSRIFDLRKQTDIAKLSAKARIAAFSLDNAAAGEKKQKEQQKTEQLRHAKRTMLGRSRRARDHLK